MNTKNNCEIYENSAEKIIRPCFILSVVDETKSDMEYNCWGCTYCTIKD